MDVEIGTEAAQFPEKEYINGIYIVLHIFSHTLGDLSQEQNYGLCLHNPVCIATKRSIMYRKRRLT